MTKPPLDARTLRYVARELLERFVHFDECARNPIETSYSSRRYRALATDNLLLSNRFEREARAAAKHKSASRGKRG